MPQTLHTLAQVILPLPIDKAFTYVIPPSLQDIALPGCRVRVSFGPRVLTGLITEVSEVAEVEKRTKPVLDILDKTPALTPELLKLTRWIATYYLCGWGEVVRAALPSGTHQEHIYQIYLNKSDTIKTSPPEISTIAKTIYPLILEHAPLSLKELQKLNKRASLAALKNLEDAGFINVESEYQKPKIRVKTAKFVKLAPALQAGGEILSQTNLQTQINSLKGEKQRLIMQALLQLKEAGIELPSQAEVLSRSGASTASLKSLAQRDFVEIIEREVIRTPLGEMATSDKKPAKHTLHKDQQQALEKIHEAIHKEKFETFLLHGVTGSGKTEVYINALKEVIARGKTGIVLVPEIALTPQTVARFRSHFGDQVAVLHSRMSPGERYDAWRMLRKGRFSIVIGPRSAILAPLSNIGIIVVDEEHESSYKQFDPAPRYHARDVAVLRASMNNAVCVLGSATPSLESYINAHAGKKYTYLGMPNRVPVPGHEAAPLPETRIIDLTLEKRKHRLSGVLTEALRLAISDRLEKKEQVILLQNRRGYASLLECKDCGWSPTCTDCAVTLTYHKVQHHLRCHYCGQTQRIQRRCPQCGGSDLARLGAGTQKIEEELETQFPNARLLRMDLDTTSGKNAHFKILDQFGKGEADILIGTQMVAKGLDFGRVTLVGVVNADAGMLLPDFRAEERTFQLLTQVAGRAGRSKLRGEVILQTRNPKHPILRFASQHNYDLFAQYALEQRRELIYPPFGRVVRVEFRGPDEQEVEKLAMKWYKGLPAQQGVMVLPPQPALISKVQKNHRHHIIFKATRKVSHEMLGKLIHTATQRAGKLPAEYRMAIDVDAVSLF